jgi:hypothetical protein
MQKWSPLSREGFESGYNVQSISKDRYLGHLKAFIGLVQTPRSRPGVRECNPSSEPGRNHMSSQSGISLQNILCDMPFRPVISEP